MPLNVSCQVCCIDYIYLTLTIFFCSKSSVLLGLSLTIPLIVACLSIAIPIWIRNGYQFWVSRYGSDHTRSHRSLWFKEVFFPFWCPCLSSQIFKIAQDFKIFKYMIKQTSHSAPYNKFSSESPYFF